MSHNKYMKKEPKVIKYCDCGNEIASLSAYMCVACARVQQAQFTPLNMIPTKRDVDKFPTLDEDVSRAMIDKFIKETK